MSDDLQKKGEENKSSSSSVDISRKIEELEKQKTEYLAGWQRERADFLNYKKEEMERIGSLMSYAGEELILKILPILDNFEIIEKKLPEDLKKDEHVRGLLLIKNQLLDFLQSQGVEEIKAIGEKFDPNLHEVVEELEAKDKTPGTIVEEIQKGYKANGRLLRPAKIKVAK